MEIIRQIKNFKPRINLQEASQKEILSQLERFRGDLFFRESLHGHMTASAIILNPGLDKVLMVYHNVYQSYSWTGGHSDGEEDLFQVALREAKEETGIQDLYPVSRAPISVESLPVAEHVKKGKIVPEHQHYNVTYGFIGSEKDLLKVKEDENSDVCWLEISRLRESCREKEMIPIYEDNIEYIRRLFLEKEEIYRLLPEKLLPWYRTHARDLPWRRSSNPYAIWISEIMLQQTRVDTVLAYYHRFMAKFPTVKDLTEADEEEVLKVWEGLGYYSRARNLHKTAKIIAGAYGGTFPGNAKDLRALPGIGSYTAGAIASIAFGLPVAAIDGNVLRVLARVIEDYRCVDLEKVKKDLGRKLEAVYPDGHCGDFTQSLMELGATRCLPNGAPLCSDCPLHPICLAYQNETQPFLPVRKEKTERKQQDKTLFVLHADHKIALQKRTGEGMLQGLWELPNVDGRLDEREAEAYLKELGVSGRILRSRTGHHIFTHIRWDMVCYDVACDHMAGDFVWADEENLAEKYAVPTVFKKFIR